MTPRELIRKVVASRTLAKPGHVLRQDEHYHLRSEADSCLYVSDDGKHCIIGEILHQLGAPDSALLGDNTPTGAWMTKPNQKGILGRPDLHGYLPPNTLEVWYRLQEWWDHDPRASRKTAEAQLEQLFEKYYHD